MDDPFALLGLPRTFALDHARIERAYLIAASRHHPDRAGGMAEATSEAGVDAAALNRARETLLDPERRGNALLALWGGPGPEDARSLPIGFLESMMAVRERAEAELEAEGEAASARWRGWAAREREALVGALGVCLAREERAATTEGVLETRRLLNALRYVERMIDQIAPA